MVSMLFVIFVRNIFHVFFFPNLGTFLEVQSLNLSRNSEQLLEFEFSFVLNCSNFGCLRSSEKKIYIGLIYNRGYNIKNIQLTYSLAIYRIGETPYPPPF